MVDVVLRFVGLDNKIRDARRCTGGNECTVEENKKHTIDTDVLPPEDHYTCLATL